MRWIDAPLEPIYGNKTRPTKVIPGSHAQISRKKKAPTPLDTDAVLLKMLIRFRNGPRLILCPDGSPTYATRGNIVEAYRTLLEEMNATHFLTFMPGYFVNPETIAANIVKFCCRLERKARGRHWFKFTRNRIRLIGFFEHPETTPHYHAIAHIPSLTESALEEFGAEIWKTLMPSGKFEAEPIKGNARRYSSKDLHHLCSPENVVIYVPMPKKV